MKYPCFFLSITKFLQPVVVQTRTFLLVSPQLRLAASPRLVSSSQWRLSEGEQPPTTLTECPLRSNSKTSRFTLSNFVRGSQSVDDPCVSQWMYSPLATLILCAST